MFFNSTSDKVNSEEQCCVLGDLSRDLEKAYDELESHTNTSEYMYMEMLHEQNDSGKLLAE